MSFSEFSNQRARQVLRGFLALVIAMMAPAVIAQAGAWPCLDGDGDRIFSTASAASLRAVQAGSMPHIVFDAADKPQGLAWIERTSAPPPMVEALGVSAGCTLYRVTYPMTQEEEKEYGSAPWACVMLAFAEPLKAGDTSLRPFYVKSGDQVAMWEASFAGDEASNAVEVRSTIQGNGVYWSNYTFAITPDGPRLTGIIAGGRRMDATHREYDKEGRLIRTSVIEGNE